MKEIKGYNTREVQKNIINAIQNYKNASLKLKRDIQKKQVEWSNSDEFIGLIGNYFVKNVVGKPLRKNVRNIGRNRAKQINNQRYNLIVFVI